MIKMMKKIIITGATSMIGYALTEVAVNKGVEVYAIIRPDTMRRNRIIKSPLVHVVYGLLENLKEINEIPEDCDVLYHFAWSGTKKTERDNPQIHEKNIKYALDAVELAKKCGCHRFIGAGSQAEYGPVDGIIDETTKFNPVTAYGIAKYAAGILSKKMCEQKGIKHIWGRIFSVYGPHDNEETMLSYAIDCFERGETAKFSAGNQIWNYLYESDAGEMFYRLGLESVNIDTCFIASQESKPLREYIETLLKIYGSETKAEFGTLQNLGLNVNMNMTLNNISYKPQVKFEEGIKKMIEDMIKK